MFSEYAYEIFAYSLPERLKWFDNMPFKIGNEDHFLQAFLLLSVCDKWNWNAKDLFNFVC